MVGNKTIDLAGSTASPTAGAGTEEHDCGQALTARLSEAGERFLNGSDM
jgi:hypothetical protein